MGPFRRQCPVATLLGEGVFPVGWQAPTLFSSSEDPGKAFLPSLWVWDQRFLLPKGFLLLSALRAPWLTLWETSLPF